MEPIFRSLRKLDFYSRNEIDESLPKWLTIVEDLRLDTGAPHQGDSLLMCFLPNLQRISFRTIHIDTIDLQSFLNRHKKIKEIHFEYLNGVDNHKLKLPVQIEKLSLRIGDDASFYLETSTFGNLKNLKSLELSYVTLYVHGFGL